MTSSKSLKKLSLDISDIKEVNDAACNHLAAILGGMAKKPEEFTVDASRTAISNKGLKSIAGGSQSSEIKKLNLYVFDVPAIDNKSHGIVQGFSDDSMKAKLYTRPELGDWA